MAFLRATPCPAVLPRRSFSGEDGRSHGERGCSGYGPHFCSMKITEDVRKYAAKKGLADHEAVGEGMAENSAEFALQGAEVYARAD